MKMLLMNKPAPLDCLGKVSGAHYHKGSSDVMYLVLINQRSDFDNCNVSCQNMTFHQPIDSFLQLSPSKSHPESPTLNLPP